MWNLLGAVMALAGLWLIYTVLVKKFPQLKLIDLSTLAKERHAEVKSRIIKDRFERSMGQAKARTHSVFGRARDRIRAVYDRAYGSLKEMEQRIESKKPKTPEEIEARTARNLSQAETEREEGRLEEAEQRYIEVLKFDPKNSEAYRGLADLYIAQKMYDQAAETLEFLVRLNAGDDRALSRLGEVEAYRGNFELAEQRYLQSLQLGGDAAATRAELGRAYLAMGDSAKAFEQFRAALMAEPYNPKYLDYFLEASILVGDPETAEEALRGLETVNPENAKLDEFRARIQHLRSVERV